MGEHSNFSMSSRGAFILLEGVDRCGKSTQCRRLIENLKKSGHQAELQCFPDRTTPIGMMIDQYLKSGVEMDDHSIHLLFSANRWECAALMKKRLEEGVHLVVDRYAFSGVAFTAAKGLDKDWCWAPDKGLLAPDLVVYMDMPIEEAAKRGEFGAERYEKLEFQKTVQQQFYDLRQDDWQVLDAQQSMDELEATIQTLASETIAACAEQPFKILS